jgi:hypothetical protein
MTGAPIPECVGVPSENCQRSVRDLRLDFGAALDGHRDDTAAWQNAIAWLNAHPFSTVVVPDGLSIVSAPLNPIIRPCAIIGTAYRGTRVQLAATWPNDAWWMTVHDTWRNGEEQVSDTFMDWSNQNAGVVIENLWITPQLGRAQLANGLRFTGMCDRFRLSGLTFEFFDGTAVHFGQDSVGACREAAIYDLHVQGCGSVMTDRAAVEIATGGAATDGTNHMFFYNLSLVYNDGIAFRCRNTSSTEVQRRIRIHSWMLHGKHNHTSAPAADLAVIAGRIHDFQVYGLHTNGSHDVGGTKYAAVRIASAGGHTPQRVVLDGLDMTSMNGHGVVVDKCDTVMVRGMVDPATIAGNEARFEASSVMVGIWDVVARTVDTRTVWVDPSVAGKVQGRLAGTRWTSPDITMAANTRLSLANGSAPSPALTFDTEPTLGFYRHAAGVAAFTADGVNRQVQFEGGGLRLIDGANLLIGTGAGSTIGNAASAVVGFHGKKVAQHASTGQIAGHTTGTGAPVTVDSTFTGGVGTKAYTIGDIVRALKDKGIIATT